MSGRPVGEALSAHKPSHLTLLPECLAGGQPKGIDAIIVPTVHPDRYLRLAAVLSRSMGCPLLILSSAESDEPTVERTLRTCDATFARLRPGYSHRLLNLSTAALVRPSSEQASHGVPAVHSDVRPYTDVATKRNLALLAGRLLGWSRLLFLDDDIQGLSAPDLSSATADLGPDSFQVIGWRYTEFPDNSVACHARRSAGLPQDVFPGSGALLVELDGWLPFFPPVYNEDWLFFFDFVAREQMALFSTELGQLPFDPFRPARAQREEFGDVLAEGLFNLIHDRRSVTVAYFPRYWAEVLAERARMLKSVVDRLEHLSRHARDAEQHERELLAVEASQEQLARITPHSLAEFVAAWRYDLYAWNARLHHLPRFSKLDEALGWLGVTDLRPAAPPATGTLG